MIQVTLHVSVWVEIDYVYKNISMAMRHAPRERVSWNMEKRENIENINMSRSTWACELKFTICK